MCDLWRNTTREPVAPGQIPTQIEFALARLPDSLKPSVLKLYNSGSFFDRGAIPNSDWPAIAQACNRFDHVIVECHPRLVTARVLDFASLLRGTLEVAMGLETVHPNALEALNKRITVHDYQRATAFLRGHGIAVRTFLLVHPPFIPADEQRTWAERSIEFSLDCGSTVVSLIPTRAGNGALEELEKLGAFKEPTISDLECALENGIRQHRARVFADTWDMDRFSNCPACLKSRVERIHQMNLSQSLLLPIHCSHCEH